jgi:hypothetical protein
LNFFREEQSLLMDYSQPFFLQLLLLSLKLAQSLSTFESMCDEIPNNPQRKRKNK